MIAGEDFVMDLCGVVDILHPMIDMFVELQSQCPMLVSDYLVVKA